MICSLLEKERRRNLAGKVLDDELHRLGRRALDALLDHVVAVLVAHALHDMPLQLSHQLLLRA